MPRLWPQQLQDFRQAAMQTLGKGFTAEVTLSVLVLSKLDMNQWNTRLMVSLLALFAVNICLFLSPLNSVSRAPINASQVIAKCRSIHLRPTPSDSFKSRKISDRFQAGTKPIWIRNATIWTGRNNGSQVIIGDIVLDGGLIKAVGQVDSFLAGKNISVVDVQGAWISPGIVDIHSHLGVFPSPALRGAQDGNSLEGPVVPWLRSIDGINTHDELFHLAVAGGVTTALILPGSANAISGEAYTIKLRPTRERSSYSLLVESPFGTNGSEVDPSLPPRWRHMKHACGENPSRFYENTRMDTVWLTHQAYDKARQIKESQDNFCSRALAGQWNGLGHFPEDLQWEPLVATLRGQVHTHCYEALDIDRFISISNEFKFPVAAFHHAHEAYLVPQVLKRAYERPPATAMFATFSRYKREAYRHSEYAPRILADEGIRVVMKSDNPAIISRYLLHEAQQAHYHGLPPHLALASVTSVAAEVIGLDHRLGFVQKGYDADIVVWDSHPLSLGATPKQVYIDGIPQLPENKGLHKIADLQKPPKTPNFDQEARNTLDHVGLPPLEITKGVSGKVIFHNVSGVWERDGWSIRELSNGTISVLVDSGKIVCTGICARDYIGHSLEIDLHGGWITPALVSFGSQIGLQHIAGEPSAIDGPVLDPLSVDIPAILDGTVVKAVDGLQFGTRDALLAYRAGVSSAISPPRQDGFFGGLSVHFSLGAKNNLDKGALLQDVVALHVSITFGRRASVSTQIALLRRLLLHPAVDETGSWFNKAAEGYLPLLIHTDSADVIATILNLKREVDNETKKRVKIVIVGGAEAHLVADQLATAGVGVILVPVRTAPITWDRRRVLPGPPLSESPAQLLLSKNVTVGIGPQGISGEAPPMAAWAARNLRFDAGWIVLDSNGRLSTADAIAIASTNIEKLLGVNEANSNNDLAVTWGNDLFSFESKVVAMISSRRGVTDIF